MTDYSDSIAIVFPADWPVKDPNNDNQPEPHVTLMYLGKVSEVSFTQEDVQSVLDRLKIKAPGAIKPIGMELFGRNENILVATLDPATLNPTRESLERVLEKVGASNASEFNDYRPHVTIEEDIEVPLEDAMALVGELPKNISLSSPVLWWGEDR